MKRTPMKRGSGFKRQTIERTRTIVEPIPMHLRRNAVFARMEVAAEPQPKEAVVWDERYRRLVAARPCINCGRPDRSQHAHENEQKGKSLKLDDRRAMPLCCDEPGREGCHTKFDQYRLFEGGRSAHVEQGRIWSAQTRSAILGDGLWPVGLPLLAVHGVLVSPTDQGEASVI